MTFDDPILAPPLARARPTMPARSVSITRASARGGRLPVSVTVSPLTDFEAGAGIYVDFRNGGPADPPTDRDLRLRDHPTTLRQGDAAIESLAALESPAHLRSPRVAMASAPVLRPRVISHLLADAERLVTGQTMTYLGEVPLPAELGAAPGWFVRGRVAPVAGRDLKSEWLRL